MSTSITPRCGLTGGAAAAMLLLAPAASAQNPGACGPTTTVQHGDTYFAISQRCDVPVSQIAAANPEVDPHALRIGQTLDLQRAEQPFGDAGRAGDQEGPSAAGVATALGSAIRSIEEGGDAEDALAEFGRSILTPRTRPETGPTPSGERAAVTGVLTEEGVECPTLRSHDGQLYSLLGDLEDHEAGDVVRVEGTLPDFSFCQRGTTLDVEAIDGA